MKRWSQAAVDAMRARLSADHEYPRGEASAAAVFLRRSLARLNDDLSSDGNMARYVYGVELLKLLPKLPGDGEAETRRIVEMIDNVLRLEGVDAFTSKLAHLHADVDAAKAQLLASSGHHDEAVWQLFLGERKAQRSQAGELENERLFEAAKLRLRLGHGSFALQALHVVEAGSAALKSTARLWRARALRLTGDLYHCQLLLSELPGKDAEWETALAKAVASGTPQNLKRIELEDLTATATAYLWAMAHTQRATMDHLLASRTLRKKFAGELKENAASGAILKVLASLRDMYDAEIPIQRRMEELSKVLTLRKMLPTIDLELLALAATARALSRFSQDAMATFVANEYESLCLVLSRGHQRDVLNLLADFDGKHWGRDGAGDDKDLELRQELPAGRLALSVELAKTTAAIGSSVVSLKVRRLFASKAEKERLEYLSREQIAKALQGLLGDVKGASMKIGQMLSWIAGPLPEPYGKILAGLQKGAPPLDSAVMRQVFKDDFGLYPEDAFADWEPQPISAASIGQVYRARLMDGRQVVVKIQYPGLERSITNAFSRLKALTPFVTRFMPGSDIKAIESELERQIVSECDFRLEATNQKRFAEIAAGMPEIKIPDLIDEFCSQRVLTMEFAEGISLARFLEEASAEEKSQAGISIIKLAMTGFFEHGILNVDPNPANFLFHNNQVTMLDFGCVRQWSPEFRRNWVAHIDSALSGDVEAHRKAAVANGVVGDLKSFDVFQSVGITQRIFEPLFRLERFTFTEEYVLNCMDVIGESHSDKSIRIEPEMIFAYRAILGLSAIAAKLRVTASFRDFLDDARKWSGAA